MKKVCSVILALSMLCLSMPAMAVTEKMVFELVSLGIVQGDENGDMHVDEYITRAEFAKVLINLAGCEDVAESSIAETVFSDVSPDNFYARYISFAYSAGILNGYPDGTYRPNDNVLLQDGIKSVVKTLGYETAAVQNGGYPSGYLNIAYTLNLTKGTVGNASAPATRTKTSTGAIALSAPTNRLPNSSIQTAFGNSSARTTPSRSPMRMRRIRLV